MLFKLAISNIRKSMRDYAVYFFTLIIGVAVFYVFNAIGSQAAFLKLDKDTREIVVLLKNLLSGLSVFVAIVFGLLIVYASRFLMKRRNKEFGLYLLLGMSKLRISIILFLESVLIVLGCLTAGMLVGIGVSQFMSAIVSNLFEADMTAYTFRMSWEALQKTVLYFGLMYVVVILFNSFVIGKYKLIELLQSDKKTEKMKLKNPWLCVAIFFVAAAALAYAYYQVGWKANDISGRMLMAMIVVGAVSTFLVFWSVSGLMLRIVMTMKPLYYRGLNSFTFRQLSSRINTMVVSMTVICLMLFVTICTLSSAFSIRNSMNDNLKKYCPVDFMHEIYVPVDPIENLNKECPVFDMCKEKGVDFSKYMSEYLTFQMYEDGAFKFPEFCGEKFKSIEKQYPYLALHEQVEPIISVSEYNKLQKLYGHESVSLAEDEFIMLCNYGNMKKVRNSVLAGGREIKVFGHTLRSKYDYCVDGFVDIAAQQINVGIVVVPDAVVKGQIPNAYYMAGNYAATTKEEKKKIEAKIQKLNEKLSGKPMDELLDEIIEYAIDEENVKHESVMISVNTRIDIAKVTTGLGAIITFLGMYIGLIFLISCAAILALKSLSESVDNIPHYAILRKIGADEGEISKSLLRQTGLFFLLPLLVAIVHSVFGMKFSGYILESMGTEGMLSSTFLTSAIILFIYGGYFVITYLCSKSIVQGER
ncbi:MAG: ABC transporter permease [Lachnospiraceae bacterium]|nr:ABC transporter permease [Lachnospiraceae bacterium]